MDPELKAHLDREKVVDTLTGMFIGVDSRDWETVRRCLAEQVLLDMSALGAGPPRTLPAEQIIEAWETGLKPLAAVHHQVGNYLVKLDADGAEVFCYATASHYLPNPSGRNTRTFVGSYEFHLRRSEAGGGWRIDHLRYSLKYIDGNPDLESS